MNRDQPTPVSRPQLISEQIFPTPGSFDVVDMGQGLPGLPSEFTWRGRAYRVDLLLEKWKASGPEIGRLGGEQYLRRHYFRIRTTDGQVMVIYCQRNTRNRAKPKARWWLYTVIPPVEAP